MADAIQLALHQLTEKLSVPIESYVLSWPASTGKNFARKLIRQNIADILFLESNDGSAVFKLDSPLLKVSHQFISITHTQTMGLWVLSATPCGVDLEDSARASQKIAARVSTQNEIGSVPESLWSCLWAAKESAFKATQSFPKHPTLMSQIEIAEWRKSDNGVWMFDWKSLDNSRLSGRGAATVCKPYALSISVVSSQL